MCERLSFSFPWESPWDVTPLSLLVVFKLVVVADKESFLERENRVVSKEKRRARRRDDAGDNGVNAAAIGSHNSSCRARRIKRPLLPSTKKFRCR